MSDAGATRATWSHVVTPEDVQAFSELSGDRNPIHLDDEFARDRGYRARVVPGALLGAYVSRVLAEQLPGPGCVSLSYELHFAQPVYIGDEIELAVEVVHRSDELGAAVLTVAITNGSGTPAVHGKVRALLPRESAV